MRICDQHDTFLHRYGFILSDDPAKLDLDWAVDQLEHQYWFAGEPRERIRRAVEGAHPYGLFAPDGSPAGFLSVLSDEVYNARLSNLLVLPEHRGRGLGRWIMLTLLHLSRFRSVRNWQLSTDDAQSLYRRFGFEVFEGNGEFMTLTRPQTIQTRKETP